MGVPFPTTFTLYIPDRKRHQNPALNLDLIHA